MLYVCRSQLYTYGTVRNCPVGCRRTSFLLLVFIHATNEVVAAAALCSLLGMSGWLPCPNQTLPSSRLLARAGPGGDGAGVRRPLFAFRPRPLGAGVGHRAQRRACETSEAERDETSVTARSSRKQTPARIPPADKREEWAAEDD